MCMQMHCTSSAGTHDVLRIALEADKASDSGEAEQVERTTMMPFANEIVPVVDRVNRRMEITPPEGLLDLVTAVRKAASRQPQRPQ